MILFARTFINIMRKSGPQLQANLDMKDAPSVKEVNIQAYITKNVCERYWKEDESFFTRDFRSGDQDIQKLFTQWLTAVCNYTNVHSTEIFEWKYYSEIKTQLNQSVQNFSCLPSSVSNSRVIYYPQTDWIKTIIYSVNTQSFCSKTTRTMLGYYLQL